MVEFKVGQTINFHSGGLYPFLIRLGTHSYWNHSAIVCDIGIIPSGQSQGQQGVLLYEAIDCGFTPHWYELWWLNAQFRFGNIAVGTPKIELKDVKANADKYLGQPYDWTDIFYIIDYLFTKSIKNEATKGLICSEAVAKIDYDSSNKQIDFVKELGKPYGYITPQDLYVSGFYDWEVNAGAIK